MSGEVQTTPYAGWAIIEQMGFKRTVGKISEVEYGGAKMIRIDKPIFGEGDLAGVIADWATEYAGGPSLYNITPVDEEYGIALARESRDPRPVRPVAYREPPPLGLAKPAVVAVLDPDNGPRTCPCGHHEGYHSDAGACLLAHECGCKGLPPECRTPYLTDMPLTDRQIIDRFAEIGDLYERMYPGKKDDWQPCGVLILTVSDLREAMRSRDRAQAAAAARPPADAGQTSTQAEPAR